MNIEALEKKHKELGDEIAKLKAEKDDPRFKPGGCVHYWFITDIGSVEMGVWTSHSVDHSRFNFGNVYETRKKAEKAAKQNKIYNLMRAYDDNGRYQICIDERGKLDTMDLNNNYGSPKFKNPSKVIELIGKDLIIDAWKRD